MPAHQSTLSFREFRNKHTGLSEVYWTSELARETLKQKLAQIPSGKYVVDEIGPYFPRSQLPEKKEELAANIDKRAGVERLHLLVICSANLEAYLQDVTLLYVAATGHEKEPEKLTPVGEAIARPVVRSSTIPDMVAYLGELLSLKFGMHEERWKTGYKLRCAAAHNGGIVTAGTVKSLPQLRLVEGSSITLEWSSLKDYLESADFIATEIDKKISATPGVHETEARWLLADWKKNGKLPAKTVVWQQLHKLGFPTFHKAKKAAVVRGIY